MRRWPVLALVAVLAVLLAACGDDDEEEAGGGGPTRTTASTSTTTTDVASEETIAVGRTSLGEILVDAEGRTLYLFTRDTGGASQCRGQCAQTWPPLTVSGEPTAGTGLDSAKIGTITREDGSRQVTYGGHPLYHYGADQGPGDTRGHGVGGVWFVASSSGEAVTAEAGG